jgi:DNA-directed RNA polymerase subunit RPC12/RpoP
MHPRAVEFLFEMQAEKVNCIRCGSIQIDKGTEVEYHSGMAVFMKYTCRTCKKEFLDKEIHQESGDEE